MLKKILLFSLFFSLLLANIDLWTNRNSPAGAEKAYQGAKANYQKNKNYTTAWQFSRAAHFYADNFVQEKEAKKKIFSQGKDAALEAINLDPAGADGHYWLGANYGSWAEENGILDSLNYADDIAEEMTKVIDLDKNFKNGMPYAIRAKVYYKAPGWPLSIGDGDKAQADFTKAVALAKNKNRKVYRFYAEYLLQKGEKEKASAAIKAGLAVPLDQADLVLENKEIKLLQELQKK